MNPKIQTVSLGIPEKLAALFAVPFGDLRYRGVYGGRGSAKSRTVATMAAVLGIQRPMRILCTREFQISIKESFHAELKAAIAAEPWLAKRYQVGVDYLRGSNCTEFFFRGLHSNIEAIKSLSGIDLCIVEEAEDIPEESWLALEPTIRAPRSEIWAIWNPRHEGSPVDRRFRQSPAPRTMMVEMNHADNPWFPGVLEEQRLHAQRIMDDATYAHIWEGAYLINSDTQVYSGRYEIKEFTPGKL